MKRPDAKTLTFSLGFSNGIMVFISFDELLPMAERWGYHHISIIGIIVGMLLMAVVLV